MNLRLRISSILALSLALSELLIKHSKNSFKGKRSDIILWRSNKLLESSLISLKSYVYGEFSKKELKKVEKWIDKFFPKEEDIDIVECISFILCSIEDMIRHSKKHSRNLLVLHKRLKWVLDFFDPKLDKNEIYESAKIKYILFSKQ